MLEVLVEVFDVDFLAIEQDMADEKMFLFQFCRICGTGLVEGSRLEEGNGNGMEVIGVNVCDPPYF